MAKKESQEEKSALENPEVLAEQLSKGEEFVQKNKNTLTYILGGLVLVVAAVMYMRNQTAESEAEAQTEMYKAQFYFESDSLNKALNGDGTNYGFVDIIDEYSGTKAANLANFYAGVISMKQGQYDDAIGYLEEFSSSDLLVQARAYALLGDAHAELKDYPTAIEKYQKAVNYRPNEQFTPMYLMKLGITQEEEGDFASAEESYNTIVKEYPNSLEVNNAKKRAARASELK